MNADTFEDRLIGKIKALCETLWERRVDWTDVRKWLNNFSSTPTTSSALNDDEIQALFLLSHFIFFGEPEIRELLRAVYRDLFKAPIVAAIRRSNGDTVVRADIEKEFATELSKARFLGMGNPSESGSHLLYYFRQENELPKTRFIHTHEIFARDVSGASVSLKVHDQSIKHYVFIDDLCGSGQQAIAYSKDIVAPLKALNPAATVSYFPLFATTDGLQQIRAKASFDRVQCVLELDDSFRCFSANSRVYAGTTAPISKVSAEQLCRTHGQTLYPDWPLGYKDGQLLIGFSHNTPDNTLPVIWYDNPSSPWVPIFRRYSKNYGK